MPLPALQQFSDPGLALATLLPLPFIAWLIHQVRDRLRLGFEKIDRVWAELTNVLSDTIPGIRVVKAFAQEKREANRFREANRHNLAVNDRVNFLWGLFTPTITLMTEIGLLVVWAFGIWQVSKGQVTVGVLTAFLAYIGRFYTRLDSMSRIVSHTQKAAAGVKRIFEILDHVSSVPEPIQPVQLAQVQGRILRATRKGETYQVAIAFTEFQQQWAHLVEKLAKAYRSLRQEMADATREWAADVANGHFPGPEQTFH